MAEQLPTIYFYLPESDWPDSNIPVNPETYQEVYKSGKCTGTYNWILQTYLRLKADGFPCEIAGKIPAEGIVVAWTSTVPPELRPGPKLILVVVCGDKGKHRYAQLHVVQNRQEMLYPHVHVGDKYLFPGEKYYIPHWPQPGLIPRDRARGDRFENVAYLGRKENLVVELRQPSWQEQMNALGLQFQVVRNPIQWNDYREIDAIVAVRSFNRKNDYYWKPASKLYNAWIAGVPAILGRCESGYRLERKSELDYLEAGSVDEVLLALKRLRDDKELRRAMVENGKLRAEELQPDQLVRQWRTFLTDIAIPAYERWCKASNSTRKVFLIRRDLAMQTKGIRIRLSNLLHKIRTM